MLGSSIKQAFGQSFKCCKKVKTREILQPTNQPMSNIELNGFQNGGLKDYIPTYNFEGIFPRFSIPSIKIGLGQNEFADAFLKQYSMSNQLNIYGIVVRIIDYIML